jgi:hypothetical protein
MLVGRAWRAHIWSVRRCQHQRQRGAIAALTDGEIAKGRKIGELQTD